MKNFQNKQLISADDNHLRIFFINQFFLLILLHSVNSLIVILTQLNTPYVE